jgi:hypothetical protein
MWRMEAKSHYCGVDYHSLGSMRLGITGFRTVVIVPMSVAMSIAEAHISMKDLNSGTKFSQKQLINTLEDMTMDQCSQLLATDGAFVCTVGPTQCLVIPPEFLCIERTSMEGASGVRRLLVSTRSRSGKGSPRGSVAGRSRPLLLRTSTCLAARAQPGADGLNWWKMHRLSFARGGTDGIHQDTYCETKELNTCSTTPL